MSERLTGEPVDDAASSGAGIGSLRRFRPLLIPHVRVLLLGALAVLVSTAADLAIPWPLKVVIDNVLRDRPLRGPFSSALTAVAGDGREQLLIAAVVALVLVAAVGALSDYVSTILIGGSGERFAAALRTGIFAHLQRQSLSYHERQRVGDLTTRLTADVDYVQDLLVAALSVLLPNLALVIGVLAVTFAVDWQIALLALAVAPLIFFAAAISMRRVKLASTRARRTESDVASVASETLAGMRLVQAYAREPHHLRLFRKRTTERLEAGLEANAAQAKLTPLVDLLTAVGVAVVLYIGARRVLSGAMSVGVLIVFFFYLSQLYKPLRLLARLAIVVGRGRASADRLHEVLKIDMSLNERADARPAPALRGAVSLTSVTFGYDPQRPILHEVSLEAAPGERVAVAGRTGAGKSTVLSLILRLYDPWQGSVRIDGFDVRDFTLTSLRSQIALVLQDSLLFQGTIFDNIAYGNEGAPREQVLAAADAAYVDEFVRDLPDGYDTVLSERGVTLSGGQRQRIGIARALVRDAPIVLLDEPTSGLDARSERYVLRGLEQLAFGRTVILVSHRPSTLAEADRVYLLEAGRIVDAGAPGEVALEPADKRMDGFHRSARSAHAPAQGARARSVSPRS